jgi:hypothetical protein
VAVATATLICACWERRSLARRMVPLTNYERGVRAHSARGIVPAAASVPAGHRLWRAARLARAVSVLVRSVVAAGIIAVVLSCAGRLAGHLRPDEAGDLAGTAVTATAGGLRRAAGGAGPRRSRA